MANTKKTTSKKTIKKVEPTVSAVSVIDTTETIAKTEATEKKAVIKKRVELDPNSIITVKNGYQGTLVYKSKKTGERFVWETFGDEQDIELSELKSAKNSYKTFFINNWFLIEDPDVIDYLGVGQYYDNALSYEDFETIFSLSPEDIEKRLARLSKGQKRSIAYRAKKLWDEGVIDSHKVVTTLEKCLAIKIIDR